MKKSHCKDTALGILSQTFYVKYALKACSKTLNIVILKM